MSTELDVVKRPRANLRLWITVVIFLAYMMAFFDRSNVALLIVNKAFTDTFGITADKGSQGLLLTVFLATYGIACFFAGPVVNRFGPRKTLGFGLLFWAVIMAVMGSVSSLVIILVCRGLLGLGESILGPSVSKFIKEWFPLHERAKANGAWFLGLQISQVLAMPLITWWIASYGWRQSFYNLALLGLVPVVLAFLVAYDLPSQHPRISKEELDYISAGMGKMDRNEENIAAGSVGSFGFVKSLSFWLVVLIYLVANAGFWGVTGWMPTYFQKTLGFSFTAMGFLAAIPYLAGAVSALIVTALMDRFNSRALFNLISCLGFGISIFGAMIVTNPISAVIIFSISQIFLAPIFPGLFAVVQNITRPAEVANATGVFNGVAYIGASVFPYAMGAIYSSTGILRNGFYLLVVIMLIGVLAGIPLVKKRL